MPKSDEPEATALPKDDFDAPEVAPENDPTEKPVEATADALEAAGVTADDVANASLAMRPEAALEGDTNARLVALEAANRALWKYLDDAHGAKGPTSQGY